MKDETIRRIRQFTEDRDWDQFHTPANRWSVFSGAIRIMI